MQCLSRSNTCKAIRARALKLVDWMYWSEQHSLRLDESGSISKFLYHWAFIEVEAGLDQTQVVIKRQNLETKTMDEVKSTGSPYNCKYIYIVNVDNYKP